MQTQKNVSRYLKCASKSIQTFNYIAKIKRQIKISAKNEHLQSDPIVFIPSIALQFANTSVCAYRRLYYQSLAHFKFGLFKESLMSFKDDSN